MVTSSLIKIIYNGILGIKHFARLLEVIFCLFSNVQNTLASGRKDTHRTTHQSIALVRTQVLGLEHSPGPTLHHAAPRSPTLHS